MRVNGPQKCRRSCPRPITDDTPSSPLASRRTTRGGHARRRPPVLPRHRCSLLGGRRRGDVGPVLTESRRRGQKRLPPVMCEPTPVRFIQPAAASHHPLLARTRTSSTVRPVPARRASSAAGSPTRSPAAASAAGAHRPIGRIRSVASDRARGAGTGPLNLLRQHAPAQPLDGSRLGLQGSKLLIPEEVQRAIIEPGGIDRGPLLLKTGGACGDPAAVGGGFHRASLEVRAFHRSTG